MSNTTDKPDHRRVEITAEPVELYKILKFEGLATSGGEAKAAVASGRVIVNGKPEIQKRKKIVAGDTIEFDNDKILITVASPSTPTEGATTDAAE